MLRYIRDPMNGLTHFIGFCLAIVGLKVLLDISIDPINVMHVVTFSVFGVGMILLYLASTLYHWLPLSETGIRYLRKIDHSMIFIYIAATYTPICLIGLKGVWGWSIFGCVWAMAVGGIVTKLFWLHAPRWLSTGFYLAMGWAAIIGIWPLIQALQTGALFWLLAGGILYSIGAVIYALKRPDPWPGILGFHEIFHLFVMAGSFCHFWVMYEYLSRMS
ncbi:hemolysin III family protein [Maridesulfovibrio ferrireducens]|uniref:PAQR family membrane homeostasis protein TrhA n=1 Tax=Maridesulfovibrio ferrireducens TaxID=246191 RepID=UPI001A290B24|nr:hemolysin III family protein [Maridesulfovibrio ferrireducens]MBI9112823.1 hemolysin III family protein [Maridesulfovibrio ferrireducens]